MSGELQIVFIYDTQCCRREEDDPKDAILYFHPVEYSEDRRIAVCGQLMGIAHFFMDVFSPPDILTLDNGKFALRRFGKRYILALGCSSVTPDWLLEKQANILFSLTKFFHRDIENILIQTKGDRELLTAKLTAMMDHYIPVSQHHGDLFALTFGILPILPLPKTANSVNYETSILLQSCMRNAGMLGGVVMYQNKVVGADIPQELAQKLAFIQPYQYPPAEKVSVDYLLPQGVHLFTVYISQEEILRAKKNASKYAGHGRHMLTGEPLLEDYYINDATVDREPSDVSSSTGFSEVSSSLQFEDTSNQVNSLTSSSESEYGCKKIPGVNGARLESGIDSSNRDAREPELISNDIPIDYMFRKGLLWRSKSFDVFPNERILLEPNLLLASSLPDPRILPLLFLSTDEICSEPLSSDVGDDELRDTEYDSDASDENCSLKSKSSGKKSFETQNDPAKIFGDDVVSTLSAQRSQHLAFTLDESSQPQHTFNGAPTIQVSPIEAPEDNFHVTRLAKDTLTVGSNLIDNEQLQTTIKASITGENQSTVFPLFKTPHPSKNASSQEDCNFQEQISSPTVLWSEDKEVADDQMKPGDGKTRLQTSSTSSHQNEFQPASLYIQNIGCMRLLLLLESSSAPPSSVIDSLWSTARTTLPELETSILRAEDDLASFTDGQSDPYCYLRYEPIWKSLVHGGKNQSMDFEVVQLMHRDFTTHPNLSELIIRSDDHVVYGYQCVGSEVYYQQSATVLTGLPTPTDLMGKVPLKAKRRLERDHNIVLF